MHISLSSWQVSLSPFVFKVHHGVIFYPRIFLQLKQIYQILQYLREGSSGPASISLPGNWPGNMFMRRPLYILWISLCARGHRAGLRVKLANQCLGLRVLVSGVFRPSSLPAFQGLQPQTPACQLFPGQNFPASCPPSPRWARELEQEGWKAFRPSSRPAFPFLCSFPYLFPPISSPPTLQALTTVQM